MSGLVAIGNLLLWVRLIWSGQFVIIFRNANVMVTGKRNEIILFKFGGHFRGLLTSHETLPTTGKQYRPDRLKGDPESWY